MECLDDVWYDFGANWLFYEATGRVDPRFSRSSPRYSFDDI
jgi:hypothetical protein